MKKYVIEKTLTDIKDGYMHCKGHKELYICKVNHTIAARTFFEDPAFWSEYLYTSKKRAERSIGRDYKSMWNSQFEGIKGFS